MHQVVHERFDTSVVELGLHFGVKLTPARVWLPTLNDHESAVPAPQRQGLHFIRKKHEIGVVSLLAFGQALFIDVDLWLGDEVLELPLDLPALFAAYDFIADDEQ